MVIQKAFCREIFIRATDTLGPGGINVFNPKNYSVEVFT
jgi:hypothetical protein